MPTISKIPPSSAPKYEPEVKVPELKKRKKKQTTTDKPVIKSVANDVFVSLN